MGHEISHALREHGRERASQQLATQSAASLAGALLGVGQTGTDLAGVVGQVTYLLPYSRIHETEADRMGVELAARAGYDPRAAITLWQKMGKLSSGSAPPALLSTHPSDEDRMKDLTEYAQKVLPLYEAARAKS
jgi:predicted Zn-dependent protease